MNRQEAIRLGEKFYEGKPCSKCRGIIRYTSIGYCVSCQNTNMKKRHQDHKEVRHTQSRIWKQKNKSKRNTYGAKYRALKKTHMPKDTESKLIVGLYHLSDLITRSTGVPHHLDHIVPVSKGGVHCQSNLQVIPASMNLSKGARFLTDRSSGT